MTSKPTPLQFLTKPQRAVLGVCQDYVAKHKRFPDRDFIRATMGWSKPDSAYDALLALTGAGYLRMRVDGKKRVFDLVEGGVWDVLTKSEAAS